MKRSILKITREVKMNAAEQPLRILYSDDLTHIGSCVSPYHKKGELFRPEMMAADVDEVADAGADVHMLQPGLGWTALWRSRVLPFREHYEWVMERYGGGDSIFDRYMLDGGDVVQVFVDRCRQRGTEPFISLRMNDYHGKELLDFSREQIAEYSRRIAGYDTALSLTLFASRFQMEHRDWRLGHDPEGVRDITDPAVFQKEVSLRTHTRHARVLNWAVPEVREHKFALIRELCENYDLDGFELDFMRDSYLFPQEATTSEQRRELMTAYCRRVRELLDRTARAGQRRRLCVRIPQHPEIYDALGINVASWHAAGVDMFNLSCHYRTEQQTRLPDIVAMAPDADHYLELTQTPMRLWRDGIEEFRMTTREQFRTSAHLAYSQGATGISLFNFMYYRRNYERVDAVFSEPPFDVIADLKNPDILADTVQHYFLSPGSNVWGIPGFALPRRLNPNQPEAFRLDMAPPRGGWQEPARLRVQAAAPLGSSRIEATFNGCPIDSTPDVAEPYPNPFDRRGGLGRPEELRAWRVPVQSLCAGSNTLELRLTGSEPVTILFIDVTCES
ncbi:MAG: hypothetical protein K9N51_03975 [Candidatus Pacebacteria bacterium]|nr:hypothetical protein [Candidatus Paceibacterota bacterium]